MQEPRFAIRGETLRTIFGADQAEELVIPEGVTRIHTAAFAGCRRLEHISLPKSLGEIGFKAFCCCGLKTVDLPEGLVTLGADALSDDLLSPFSDLRLPNSLRGALRLVLHGVRALERVELPASVCRIEDCAFAHETGGKLQAVVAAPKGSYALEYAREKQLNWEAL